MSKTLMREPPSVKAGRNAAALTHAFARAEANKVELLKRPDMVNGEQLASELGLSRATVDNRRQEGKLLALEFGSKRGFRFPLWQRELLQERDVRAAFETTLAQLAGIGAWSRYRFFVQTAPALEGMTPIEALRAGRGDAVLRAAESWAQGEQGGG